MIKCDNCSVEYSKIGQHWRYRPGHRPDITDRQEEVLVGALLGDATLIRNGKNCAVRLHNTNVEFLEWFSSELEGIVYDVKMVDESGDTEILGVKCSQKDQYIIQTCTHPHFNKFRSWYESGQKRFPDGEISPLATKVWYCCDGSNHASSNNVRISVYDQLDQSDKLNSLTPIDTYVNSGMLYLDKSQFLRWVGDPIKGMEYKWPDGGVEK